MFTGLIEDLGRVLAVRQGADGATIDVQTALAPQIAPGDSVAVNGVCLTATELRPDGFSAQAMAETLRRSTLGSLRAGSPVNLELALRADARLGGHIVQGHVDGTATVAGVREEGFARVLDLEIDAGVSDEDGGVVADVVADEWKDSARNRGGVAHERGGVVNERGGVASAKGGVAELNGGVRAGKDPMRYLVQKGSVALDGVSLTVSRLSERGFSVSLIPETLQRTNLGGLHAGDRVNIEVDVLAKHVERLMEARA